MTGVLICDSNGHFEESDFQTSNCSKYNIRGVKENGRLFRMDNVTGLQRTNFNISTMEMTTDVTYNFCSWTLPIMEWVKIIVLSLGAFGNGLAFFTIVISKRLHSQSFAIIASIALSDCIYCFGGVLWGLLVYPYMDPKNYRNLLNCLGDFFDTYVKQFMAGTMSAAYIASGFFIATFSVFRFIIIRYPSKSERILSKKSVAAIILSVCLASIAIAVPSTRGKIDRVIDFVVSYIIPLAVMFIFYMLKLVTLMNRKHSQTFNSASIRNMEVVCALIIVAFFALLLPWHVLALMSEFGDHRPEYLPVTISAFLLQLNNCINPIFYAYLSPRVRKVLTQCFCTNRRTSKSSFTSMTMECSNV